jgi:hypothetical protein
MESIRCSTSSHGLLSEMLSSQNATAKVHWQERIYEDEKDEEIDTGEEVLVIDPDFKLFLKCYKALLQSRNPAVVVALVSCYLYLGTFRLLEGRSWSSGGTQKPSGHPADRPLRGSLNHLGLTIALPTTRLTLFARSTTYMVIEDRDYYPHLSALRSATYRHHP